MTDSDDIDSFCHRLPKVELHAHLNTSYSVNFLQDIIRQNGSEDAEAESLCISEVQSLEESFAFFTKIQQLFRTEENIYKLTRSVIQEFAEDNVKYLELRSTPKDIPETGMTRELYMQTMVRAVQDCAKDGLDITVRLLVSIDRRHGVEVAKLAVDIADQMMQSTGGLVLGIDFSGDPEVGDAKDFIPVFLDAAKRGLKLALHLAEIPLYDETKEVIRACGEHCDLRIGHGTFLHRYEAGSGHEEIEDMVIRWRIPVEACVTSNIVAQTVENAGAHHFQYWRNKQHPVILCTDGKGVFGSTLSEEYAIVAKEFSIGKTDLMDYATSTIDYIFAEEWVKERLRENFKTYAQKEFGNIGR